MPSPSSSRRVEQCVFTEGGRRCRRSGLGDPPVCNAHKVAFVEAARAGAKPKGARAVGDGIYDLIDRLVSGKKVTKKVAREAFADARNIMDEIAQAQANGTFRMPEGFAPPPNWKPRQTPPPDPEAQKRALKEKVQQRARQLLGFTPREPLTEEVVKKRHRELARKHHPDRGGSLERMKEVNAAVDVLLESLH